MDTKDNKCSDCKVVFDHLNKLEEFVERYRDTIAKIPSLCEKIEKLFEWTKDHLSFAESEIKENDQWKRKMEEKIHAIEKERIEIERDRDKEINRRFNNIDKMAITILLGLAANLIMVIVR